MVNREVVFQRVGTGDVIVVFVLASPDDTASLIFLARDGLELYFHKAVLEGAIVLEANRISGLAGLLQDVGLAGRGVVGDHRPLGLAGAGVRTGPIGRQFA